MTDLSMHGRTRTRPTPRCRPHNGTSRSRITNAPQPELLDADTEVRLIRSWQENGDKRSLERLVTSYQCLVNKIANRYRGSGLPMDDLVSEGNVGLMHAIGRFEIERGFRLSTYAMWWIRAAISDYAMNASSTVRFLQSDRQKRAFFALRRMRARVSDPDRQKTADGDIDALADELAIPRNEVAEVRDWMDGRDLSINVNAGVEGSSGEEWQDFLVDESADPEAAYMAEEEDQKRRELLMQAVDTLDDRERDIVTSRHISEGTCKLSTLGDRYGVSRERIRQIEARALEKLRKRVRSVAASHGLLETDD